MTHTTLFDEAHEAELRRIATIDTFASKIAMTILSREDYVCSPKQAYILNKEAKDGFEFFQSNGYSNDQLERIQRRQRNLMYV